MEKKNSDNRPMYHPDMQATMGFLMQQRQCDGEAKHDVSVSMGHDRKRPSNNGATKEDCDANELEKRIAPRLQDHWMARYCPRTEMERLLWEEEMLRKRPTLHGIPASSIQPYTPFPSVYEANQFGPTFVRGGQHLRPAELLRSHGNRAVARSTTGLEIYNSDNTYSGIRNLPGNTIAKSQEGTPVLSPEDSEDASVVISGEEYQQSPRACFRRGEGVAMVQPTDKAILTSYQMLVRESLVLFSVQKSDILLGHFKRKPEIGQVGLRCRYCEHLPPHRRRAGAVYFPGRISAVYQAAQNIASNHLLKCCADIPPSVRKTMIEEKMKLKKEPRRSGGNSYWVETIRFLDVEDRANQTGLWVKKRPCQTKCTR